ncbi:MAG: hypothetical protein IT289_03700 [Oligoflexia bacterium]|nr:hypothetical protein [Oligoflexia bacterium]
MKMRTLVLIFILIPWGTWAWETDQITNREMALTDSAEIINAWVNKELIKATLECLNKSCGKNEINQARRIFLRTSTTQLLSRIEEWIIKNKNINKIVLKKSQYRGAAHPVAYIRLSPTIEISGVRLGTDKIAHFFSEGFWYFNLFSKEGSETRAIKWGRYSEENFFGQKISGVMSNADLVANYEGLKFYQSLFYLTEFGAPLLRKVLGGFELTRPFDIRNHVSPFWDEVILPSRYQPSLKVRVLEALKQSCHKRLTASTTLSTHDELGLRLKYQNLDLDYQDDLKIDRICLQKANSDDCRTPFIN